MAGTTSAPRRRVPSTHPIPYFASHWEAPHEIHIGEREDAPRTILVCAVLPANRRELSTRDRDAAVVLRPSLLFRSLQESRAGSLAASYRTVVPGRRRPGFEVTPLSRSQLQSHMN